MKDDELKEKFKASRRKENTEDLDVTLNQIREACLKHGLRVGQLFENVRFLSEETSLFKYSNERLSLVIERDFNV
jgi:hypothetical protein